eukprot:2083917-Rhodomonas_salina.1
MAMPVPFPTTFGDTSLISARHALVMSQPLPNGPSTTAPDPRPGLLPVNLAASRHIRRRLSCVALVAIHPARHNLTLSRETWHCAMKATLLLSLRFPASVLDVDVQSGRVVVPGKRLRTHATMKRRARSRARSTGARPASAGTRSGSTRWCSPHAPHWARNSTRVKPRMRNPLAYHVSFWHGVGERAVSFLAFDCGSFSSERRPAKTWHPLTSRLQFENLAGVDDVALVERRAGPQ